MAARTEHAVYTFTVKEHGDGSCWLCAEPYQEEMPVLEHAFIGFNLPDGTTIHRAEKIAEFLNANLTDMHITLFESHPQYHRGDK